jgi:hypothetical protein
LSRGPALPPPRQTLYEPSSEGLFGFRVAMSSDASILAVSDKQYTNLYYLYSGSYFLFGYSPVPPRAVAVDETGTYAVFTTYDYTLVGTVSTPAPMQMQTGLFRIGVKRDGPFLVLL